MFSPAVPPAILVSNSTVLENTQYVLHCTATGDPTPTITWSLGGSVLPSSQGMLSFSPVLRSDAGVYTCTASNAADTVTLSVHLDVQCEEGGDEGLTVDKGLTVG